MAAWVADRVLPFLTKRTNDDSEDSDKSQPLAAEITEVDFSLTFTLKWEIIIVFTEPWRTFREMRFMLMMRASVKMFASIKKRQEILQFVVEV